MDLKEFKAKKSTKASKIREQLNLDDYWVILVNGKCKEKIKKNDVVCILPLICGGA